MSRRNYVSHAHAHSRFWAVKTVTPVFLLFRQRAIAALAWTKKKRSLRKRNFIKGNRASETEEQMKERLRIEDKMRK